MSTTDKIAKIRELDRTLSAAADFERGDILRLLKGRPRDWQLQTVELAATCAGDDWPSKFEQVLDAARLVMVPFLSLHAPWIYVVASLQGARDRLLAEVAVDLLGAADRAWLEKEVRGE